MGQLGHPVVGLSPNFRYRTVKAFIKRQSRPSQRSLLSPPSAMRTPVGLFPFIYRYTTYKTTVIKLLGHSISQHTTQLYKGVNLNVRPSVARIAMNSGRIRTYISSNKATGSFLYLRWRKFYNSARMPIVRVPSNLTRALHILRPHNYYSQVEGLVSFRTFCFITSSLA